MNNRWWFPFTGMEELSFKRVPDGWVYRAPNPWLFGSARYYLLDEAQKSEIAGHHRRAWRFLWLAIVVIVAASVPMTASDLDAPRSFAVLAGNMLIGLVVGMISNGYLCRAIRPVVASLRPTTQRITRGEAIERQIAVFSGRYILFFGLLSSALFALTALPPLLTSAGWDAWSVCGALLFGPGAVYWFALYVAKRKRAAA